VVGDKGESVESEFQTRWPIEWLGGRGGGGSVDGHERGESLKLLARKLILILSLWREGERGVQYPSIG
jgi:hypothetical protein